MAGQIPDDPFAGSLTDPSIDPFEIPEVEPGPTPAGQARPSVKPVPGPISPDKKLPPENLYSRWRNATLNALGANDPALNTVVPNPLYSPRLNQAVSKIWGAIQNPASVYPPALQNVANKFQQGIGAATSWIDPQAKDIANMLLGSVFPEKEAGQVIWGAAKHAMQGGMELEPWAASMRQDAAAVGRTLDESRLPQMYEKSKGIYEGNIAKAPLNELSEKHLPSLQNIVDQYNAGREGADWYLHTRPELEQQFGPDTDLFVNLLAATSPNNTVPANLTQALKAYKAYKNGVPFEAVHPGWMKSQISNMYRAVNGEPLQGQKIINFAKNLRGETEPVTVDRWMMRALGMPNAPIGTNTYKFADYWLSQIAHGMGIEPRQLQAAVWKTAREVGGESASTGQPFEAMLAKRLGNDPNLNSLLGRVRSGAAQDVLQQAPNREQILASLLPKWTKTAPTAMTGTMEVASRQTPVGNTAAELYDRLGGMDQANPEVQRMMQGYRDAQQNAFYQLGLPKGRTPSVLSQLRSAVTGDSKSIDDTISTRGTYGTFDNEINPNIQFSMAGMSEPQRHAMLSILGHHFNQAYQAASHFEAIPKADSMYLNPDTYSVFLHAHPSPQEINQFANHVGFPVNVRQYSNGTMLDLNTGGMDTKPTLDQVRNAVHQAWGPNDHGVGYLPRRYNSDYLGQEEYQDKINALERIYDDARRSGQAGNTPQSLGNLPQVRQQIEAIAQARNKAFQDWTQATQARLKALGYARGGITRDPRMIPPPVNSQQDYQDWLFQSWDNLQDAYNKAHPKGTAAGFEQWLPTPPNVDPAQWKAQRAQWLERFSGKAKNWPLPSSVSPEVDVRRVPAEATRQQNWLNTAGWEDWQREVDKPIQQQERQAKSLAPGMSPLTKDYPPLLSPVEYDDALGKYRGFPNIPPGPVPGAPPVKLPDAPPVLASQRPPGYMPGTRPPEPYGVPNPDPGDWMNPTDPFPGRARGGLAAFAGGGAIDGGWYGENSPSPVRMADGGWWPSFDAAARKIVNSTPGSYMNSIYQGAIDPVIGGVQLINRAIPLSTQAAVDEQLRNYREQYFQSLPGGKEDWAHKIPRWLATGLVESAVIPEVKIAQGLGAVGSKIASGALEGALYGLPVPKESPNTLQETGISALGGAGFGVAERFLAPPAEQGIAALMSKFGVSPKTASQIGQQATWRASDIIPDPSDPVLARMHEQPHVSVPPMVEHEAEAQVSEAAGQEANPVAHALARNLIKRFGDASDPTNFLGKSLQPEPWTPPSPPTPPTPDRQGQQSYDPLYDPLYSSGEPYARGGLYGQMRRASLRALHPPAR